MRTATIYCYRRKQLISRPAGARIGHAPSLGSCLMGGEGRTAVLCCGPAAVGLRLLRSSLSLLQRPKLPAAAGSELFIVLYHLAGPLWWPCSLLQWLAANSYDSVPLLICHPHLIILNILSSPSLAFLPFQIAPTRLESKISSDHQS